MHQVGSQLVKMNSELNVSPHWWLIVDSGTNAKWEGAHDNRVMFELLEAQWDIFGMESKIICREQDLYHKCMMKSTVNHDHSKCAVKFRNQLGGCHEIDRDGVHGSCFTTSKTSQSFFPSLIMLCCSVRNTWWMNHKSNEDVRNYF